MLFYEALPDRGDRRSLTSVKKSASVSQARLRVSSGGAPGSTAGGLTLGSPGGPMIMSPPQRKISTPTGGVANLLLPSPTRTTPEGIVCIVAGANGLGQTKTPDMPGSIRAHHGRTTGAREARFFGELG